MQNKLEEIFTSAGINVNKNQIAQFIDYYNLLIEYNNKINLTAITEPIEVIIKHFLDSVLPYKELELNATIIDIGTGAGFPLVPLKIIRPDLKITLVDSLNKRINFLNEVVKTLSLKDVTCIHSRAEDLATKIDFRQKFDYCVARAVAKLNTLSELTLPFIRIGGKLLAYKADFSEELASASKALGVLGGKFEKTLSFELPQNMGTRNIIVIKKVSNTPQKYPRGANKPKSNPL